MTESTASPTNAASKPETAILVIDIRAYWHTGTGRGASHHLDALALTDADGLPYLPGRTLKGMLRHAVECLEDWKHLEENTTVALFGGFSGGPEGQTRHNTAPSPLIVGNGAIDAKSRALLQRPENAKYRQALFQPLFNTAIDPDSGTAADKSLRSLQAVIPLRLESHLEFHPPRGEERLDWIARLNQALPLIRHVGAHGSRGLGRAILHLEKLGSREKGKNTGADSDGSRQPGLVEENAA